MCVTRDATEAVGWLRKAAEQGDASAQWNLAWAYEKGDGVSRDMAQANDWYAQGAPGKQLSGSRGHGLGRTATEDPAISCIRAAANAGLPFAQCKLGDMYATGAGVSKSPDEAANWWHRAAAQGMVEAQIKLWDYYANRGAPKDQEEAAKWLTQAAERGLAVAEYDLAVLYTKGTGVPDQRHRGPEMAQARGRARVSGGPEQARIEVPHG